MKDFVILSKIQCSDFCVDYIFSGISVTFSLYTHRMFFRAVWQTVERVSAKMYSGFSSSIIVLTMSRPSCVIPARRHGPIDADPFERKAP